VSQRWRTYFRKAATIIEVFLLLGRGLLAESGIGSLPLLLLTLLCKIYFVLGDETRAYWALRERWDVHKGCGKKRRLIDMYNK
jgi:hypothetical protein